MRMALASAYGGPEADPPTMLDAIETIARADGAAGWCSMIASTTSSQALFLDPVAAHEIYDEPTTVTGGVFAPNGTGVVDGGTVTVSGRWQWGSGTQHCAWILGGTRCDDGTFRLCFFEAADVTFHDTWHTSGLRGSGSLDFSVDGAVVPLARTIQPFASRPTLDVPLAWFPNFSLLAACVVGRQPGHRPAGASTSSGRWPTASDRSSRRRRWPRARSRRSSWPGPRPALRSARAFLHDEVGRAWDEVLSGQRVDVPSRVGIRLAAVNAVQRGAEVADVAFTLAGGFERLQQQRPAALPARRPHPDPAPPGRPQALRDAGHAPCSARTSTPPPSDPSACCAGRFFGASLPLS